MLLRGLLFCSPETFCDVPSKLCMMFRRNVIHSFGGSYSVELPPPTNFILCNLLPTSFFFEE